MSDIAPFANILIGYATKKRKPYIHVDGAYLNPQHIAADGIHVEPPEKPGWPAKVTITFLTDQLVILNSETHAKDEARRIVAKVFGDDE